MKEQETIVQNNIIKNDGNFVGVSESTSTHAHVEATSGVF